MGIIDFHSHILPGIDDGSKSIDTTIEMLKLSCRQGVETVVATPHFYASRDRMEDFLERRDHALNKVQLAIQELSEMEQREIPKIRVGSEVAFFPGISYAEQISELTIRGTNLMLLEMPFGPWTSSYISEVENLIRNNGFTIILAHLERYMGMKENKKLLEELRSLPVYVQINAESLADWKQRGKLTKMFQKKEAHLLGTDCHGIHHRVPNIHLGRDRLQKKLGDDFLREMDQLGEMLLNPNT